MGEPNVEEAEKRIKKAIDKQAVELDLARFNLTSLPVSVRKLGQLQELDLDGNNLTELPHWLVELEQLHTLYLLDNKLTYVPEFIKQFKHLRDLDLGGNQIYPLPEWLGELKQLTSLHLSNCKLTEVPDWLAQLKNLENLSLANNQLKALPKWFSKLVDLGFLHLSSNQFVTLPIELTKLAKLEILYLSNNEIRSLPKELAQLESLKDVDLNNNPLTPGLKAAYKQGIDALKEYLQANDDGQVVLNEAKLILVGDGEVGKTSLLGAMRRDDWVENRETTHGVEVTIKPLEIEHSGSGNKILFNCWDFGGQDVYKPTHQLFFTAPGVYLAVWEPRRGSESLKSWIKIIKHRAFDENRPDERPRVIIVATHGGPNERQDHIDEQKFIDEFPTLISGFYHVDSKSEDGLEKLEKAIADNAADIPQLFEKVPKSWKNILNAVRKRSKKDPYITYDEFRALCRRQKVTNERADLYTVILNSLGHLIHYKDDPILKDLVILKPEWLSKAVSFVLEDGQVKEQHGLIEHKRLKDIWHNPVKDENDRYPETMYPVFLQLMEKFDISYPLAQIDGDNNEISLITQLIPGGRPVGWQKEWQLNSGDKESKRVYRVFEAKTGRTAEAEGVMSRLIARLHRFSLGKQDYKKSCHWKNGMILENGIHGRALVEEINSDIHITVRAAYPEYFLNHICYEIDSLFASFWLGLDASLSIPCQQDGCAGVLKWQKIINDKKEGLPKTSCNACETYYEIDTIISSIAPKQKQQDDNAKILKELKKLSKKTDKIETLSTQTKAYMGRALENVDRLRMNLSHPAKDGPRFFSFKLKENSNFNPKSWVSHTFELTLWCEHKLVPVTALNPQGDKRGVYEIELKREWLKKAAPTINIIATTLKIALPALVPGTKLATDDDQFAAIDEELNFAEKTTSSMITGGQIMADGFATDRVGLPDREKRVMAAGSVLSELHGILKKQDAKFGGLVRVENKRGEFLWVHEDFVAEYY
ncbi:MAG: leucine-rich repeat domain-containing protein [Magnetococcales bacterium]|nr:leucine-rich repeat domain-containing protein [Magnetococcales bacterium]